MVEGWSGFVVAPVGSAKAAGSATIIIKPRLAGRRLIVFMSVAVWFINVC